MHVQEALFLKSSAFPDQCPDADRPEFAFIGRSNVGKSSLINMLVQKKSLAKTSATPGKTQLINHFTIRSDVGNWYLVDLPGYGYAKSAKTNREKWQTMILNYLTSRENLVCTMVLIDVRIPPQKIDLEFIEMLGDEGLPFAVVFTKADKEKPGAVERSVNAFCAELMKMFVALPNLIVTSASTRLGREALLSLIEEGMKND